MESFDEFYKKWREKNGKTNTNPQPYKKVSDEQIIQSAMENIDKSFEKFSTSNFHNNSSNSTWNKIQSSKENSFSNVNNTKRILNNTASSSKETILDRLNNWVYGNKINIKRENKNILRNTKNNKIDNNILEKKYKKENQENEYKESFPIVFANQEKILLPVQEAGQQIEKNDNVWKDILDLANISGRGAYSGVKQVGNYIENANENNFSNYTDLRKQQFLMSPKVKEEDKAQAKMQNNLLLNMNGYDTSKKVETNLVKKAIQDSITKDEEEIQKMQSRISNRGISKLSDIAPSVGQMLPGTVLSSVNPLLGTSYFMTSSGGSYIDEAKRRGMTDKEAFTYGTIMGALEGASESIITGQQLSKVKKAFTGKEISKNILNSYGFNVFENAIQEAVMEPAQEITAGIIGNKADWSNMGSRMLESGFNGALMGAITNGVTSGLEKSGKVYNKLKNGEKVNEVEYKEALQENINKFGLEEVEKNIRNGANEVYSELNRVNDLIYNQTISERQEKFLANNQELGYNNLNESESSINGGKTIKQNDQRRDEGVFPKYGRWQENDRGNQRNLQRQQITQPQNKTAQNGNIEQRLQELKNIDTSEMNFLEKSKVKSEIRALEEGYISVDEWRKANEIKKQEAIKEYNEQKIQKELKKEDFSSFNLADNHKQEQLDIINKNNPADDDMHTWIRSTNDIKNFEEAFFEDGQYSGLDPDFTEEMANKAKETGKITVYSSYPIEQGIFVSPSVLEASQYAGGDVNKLYSKEINIDDVAWIDGAEGQYAKVNNLANNRETLYNNTESEGGINGRINQRDDGASRIFEESTKEQREYSWDEYNKWEQSIQPIEEANITDKERKSINKSKTEHNKDIYLFDENDNDNTYSGGASRTEKNKINISRQQAEYFGLDFMIDHETIESDILQNVELYKEIVKPVLEKIKKDSSFKKQTDEFWKNEEGNKPSDNLIAKDIFCDRFAQRRGNELKYNNILSQDTNMNIDYALDNFYKEIYGKELEESSSINLLEKDIAQEEKFPTRHETIQNNREIARENIENISTWKDKKSGIRYQLETMERNMYDIIPDKEEAKKINDTYFEPIHTSEAEKQKFINSYNDRIKQFELNKYEAEAVQFLGEKKYNPDFTKGSQEDISIRNEIATKISKNIENGKINEEKVNSAIEEFRKIYDELFDLENNVLKENGYKEKTYRKGYFPHFIDYVPETKTEKFLNKLGFKIDKRPLPTDIAGITEQFVPGKTWNRSSLERKGNKTDYNALKGFDTYIAQAADNIFHTENIQRLRGLENEIRYQYSDKGLQERINGILDDETLYEDEKQTLIDRIFEQVENPVPNLVTELRRYTNALANKKSEADRSIENMTGRSMYSTVNAIENRFGANAVGLNIGSAITNFIPITQAYSQISTKNMGRAIIDTVKSYVRNDGFVDKSSFLTSRINQSEKLYKTSLEKISDKTSFLFNAIDEVTSNVVVRGKYLENIKNGMSESEAIKNADQFARNIISDRSKGALPTKFEEKNPVTKMFTQFQLEVNNQYRYMFKDLPRDLAEKGLAGIALAFFKMFIGAWLYNEASEKITGRKPAFSPIDLISSSYKTISDKNMKTYDKVANVGTDIAEQLPFVGGLVGGGRVPVNGAIPDMGNLTKAGIGLATGEMDSNKAMNTIGKEISKPLYYLLPPFGGGQLKKSIEGIQTVKNGGSYGIDNKGNKTLQFPVENPTVVDYVKAGVFGKYSLPLAKDYVDSGYKSLNAKDTKGYEEAKIPYKEFMTYINSNSKKKEEKINFINNMKLNEQQKWDMYCYDIFENEQREKDKGSQLEDAKFAVKNGISKSDYIKLYNNAKSRNMDMPTKKENEKLIENGIKLKSYMNYTIKIHDETKKQRDGGEIKENEQLKNKYKIQILLDSDYSENEKMAIYKNYINSEDKKVKLVEKLNLPIAQYLKYKTQEFKNDKDEDGESIKGSKKEKVYNYLNSIDDNELSVNFKKIICKIEGAVDKKNNYDKDIVDFITKDPELTGEEQKELLEIIGFDVDKNGYIKTTMMLPIKKNVK